MRDHVGAPINAKLAEKALSVADRIRSGAIKPQQADEVVKVVCEMTEAAMTHFFVKPVKDFGGGITMRGLAEMGVSGSVRAVHFGLGKILHKLDQRQWVMVADFLDQSLVEVNGRPQ
ncbi:hypothetical protein ED208_08635 [Stagnimonas aquatica]|uniref:Uncharacterized protein n=1 Tax=Stagnimonas aquatica TaxID=2689987 RepID=A0A3N0VE77_9GAMM|nr:hypothetical protein [Stagnimonas aquatica]ROH91026.1 hypothetical protein ED208_08635 [Stagnimonas aquatica]